MNDWPLLNSTDVFQTIIENSKTGAIGIFKHSTRCSISSMALSRVAGKHNIGENLPTYYLDVLQSREISNLVADTFSVKHESPQFLIIHGGKCVYSASHTAITQPGILAEIPA